MDSETSPARDPDNILAQWPSNYALSAKDALAYVSFMVFLLAPMGLALSGVMKWLGIASHGPARDPLHDAQFWRFVAAFVPTVLVSVLTGKYLWLVAMCRILNRANVGPWVAYGRPRRIWRYDRALIVRLYKTHGPALETRLVPPKPIGYFTRLIVTTFLGGALVSLGLGFLPIMRGDSRSWQGAIFFVALALLFGIVGHWEKRQRP